MIRVQVLIVHVLFGFSIPGKSVTRALLLLLLLLLHGRKHTDNEQASPFGGRSCRSSSRQRK